MADETDKFVGGNPMDPNNYAPPEDKYEDLQPQNQAPGVSAPAARNFVFIGVFALIAIVIVYIFFSGGDEDKAVQPKKTGGSAPQKIVIPAPLTPPPPIPAPPLPAIPPAPIDNNAAEQNKVLFTENTEERTRRDQSNMLIGSSGGLFSGNTNLSDKPKLNENDPNVGFADSFYNQGDVPFATARRLGNTGRLITQGKIIESVLETPINTDLPGSIRAIVSRDIYAESGRAILIPKGSRLIGTYNNLIIRGTKRINIIWSRVIRPDGIDIMIRSEATDQLGRAGIPAEVDNKYAEIFASAFLVSAINIAIGAGVDAINNKDERTTTTTNTDGSTTTNSDATNEAALQAVDLFGNAGQNLLNGFLNMRPTATIDQGTRINVFVNRDLVFPGNLGNNQIKFIQ